MFHCFSDFLLTMLCNSSPDVQFESAWGSHQHCIIHVWPDQSCMWVLELCWIHLIISEIWVNDIDFFMEYCENLIIFLFLISLLGNFLCNLDICVATFWILLCHYRPSAFSRSQSTFLYNSSSISVASASAIEWSRCSK
jgi:hypothetical protein